MSPRSGGHCFHLASEPISCATSNFHPPSPFVAQVCMPANPVELPVTDEIANRYSPYLFADRNVSDETLTRVFEAGRWAASSFNDQPWYWIVARRDDQSLFEKVLANLEEANRGWAAEAPVLYLAVLRTNFKYNGKPNRVALHDLGAAHALMSLQAAAMGLQMHQMAGVKCSAANAVFAVPSGHEVQTAGAIGYPDTDAVSGEDRQAMRKREQGARTRRPLSETVWSGSFGDAAEFLVPGRSQPSAG